MKKCLGAVLFSLLTGGAMAQSGEAVRIAYIDPLSGPFAQVGVLTLKSFQFAAQRLGGRANPAGVTFEVKGFDNKFNAQESLQALRTAIDQGYRYILSGGSSGAAIALSDAIAKYNLRNPGKEVVFLDYQAQDPALTNEKCNYWHFRFDADTSMKMEALTSFLKDSPKVSKVYLFNQNYSHGQQLAKYFKEGLARNRPDIAIVGEELIPLGQVKDFAPYVAKIKQSGADAIVTGNGGPDLTLFVKALSDSGMKIPLYTSFANVPGTPTALAGVGDIDVYVVNSGHAGLKGDMADITADFRKANGEDFSTTFVVHTMTLLGEAMARAKSTEPSKVAAALNGASAKGVAGDVTIRKSDHQIQLGLFVEKWQKVDAKNPYSVENTGYTFAPIRFLESHVASTPTSCQMQRP